MSLITFQTPQGVQVKLDVVLQDCQAGMAALKAGSVDCIVTSPPYNIGTKYDAYEDSRTEAGFTAWFREVVIDCYRVLATDGSFFLNLGGPAKDPLWPFRLLNASTLGIFAVQNVFHWVKAISLDGGAVKGHLKPMPPKCRRFVNQQHEYIFHLTKTGEVPLDRLGMGVPFADTSNLKRGQRGANGNLRDRGNTWFLPYETVQKSARDRPHPAVFPISLPEACIKTHGLQNTWMVMDPFLGIGTTLRACARLGVSGIGFEVSEGYYAEAIRRVLAEVKVGMNP